jgi:hypothetical protein
MHHSGGCLYGWSDGTIYAFVKNGIHQLHHFRSAAVDQDVLEAVDPLWVHLVKLFLECLDWVILSSRFLARRR